MEVASGVISLGLMTQVHPEAKMGPNLYPRLSRGKFHVRTHTTTPTGVYLKKKRKKCFHEQINGCQFQGNQTVTGVTVYVQYLV